ncbi:hypothetical protein U1Q18_025523, partial [Sarracenia purpurea var. burkii]
MVGLVHEAMGIPHMDTSIENDEPIPSDPRIGKNEETTKYFKLLEDAQSELYP